MKKKVFALLLVVGMIVSSGTSAPLGFAASALSVAALVFVFVLLMNTQSNEPIFDIGWAAHRNSLTQADFVEDVEYMLAFLAENFPSFGVLERRGVDFLQLGEDFLYEISSLNNLGFDGFLNRLWDGLFAYSSPVGHLNVVNDFQRHFLVDSAYYGLTNFPDSHFVPQIQHNLALLNSPAYRPLNQQEINWVNSIVANPEGLLDTEILEEGRIAYLRFNAFPQIVTDEHRRIIEELYAEIMDFEHLIIDMRGNTGGFISFFTQFIAPPLLGDEIATYVFSMHSDTAFIRNFSYISQSYGNRQDSAPISQIFYNPLFTEYVLSDMEGLDYFFEERIWIEPYGDGFAGEIWILVDGYVMSAAQLIVTLA